MNSVTGQLITCSNTNLWLRPDVSKAERRPPVRQIGLKPDEINLLSTVPRQICEQAHHYEDLNDWVNDKGQDTEYLLDLNGSTPLHKLLMNENFKLVEDILAELQEHDMEKWENVQIFKLYPDIMKDSEVLYEKCQVAE